MRRPDQDTQHPATQSEPAARAPDSTRRAPAARRILLAQVVEAELDVAAHAALVQDPAAGAVVSFAGTVRDHDHGRVVTALEYVAHPSAGQVITDVAQAVAAAYPVDALAISHRVGRLRVGAVALAVAVSAAHRREAFEAATELVEEVKRRLPIWKRQELEGGTDEWVACP